MTKELPNGKTVYYLNAPTGTDKPTIFPLCVAKYCSDIGRKGSMIILQPNVTAVRGTAKRLGEMRRHFEIKSISIMHIVGNQNENNVEEYGDGEGSDFSITVKTYGKNLRAVGRYEPGGFSYF